MGVLPDHPNNPAYVPDPWFECNWADPCHEMVHEDSESAPLCWIHYQEQLAEEQAETAMKMAKEDW